jgi:hypothetical protein
VDDPLFLPCVARRDVPQSNILQIVLGQPDIILNLTQRSRSDRLPRFHMPADAHTGNQRCRGTLHDAAPARHRG